MIVFTVKNNATNDVFAGTAKESIEDQWAKLIVQANEGCSGDLPEQIREYGPEQFETSVWGYADSTSEARELVKEARDIEGALLIKVGRATAPASSAKPSIASSATSATSNTGTESAPLRQEGSTKDYDEIKALMVQIELKRKENQKSKSKPAKAAKSAAASTSKITKSGSAHSKKVSVANGATDKLPVGRVSSSSKEKRIKEAIAKEREQRAAEKAAKVAAEADEMAAIMARLDERNKAASKIMRRR